MKCFLYYLLFVICAYNFIVTGGRVMLQFNHLVLATNVVYVKEGIIGTQQLKNRSSLYFLVLYEIHIRCSL